MLLNLGTFFESTFCSTQFIIASVFIRKPFTDLVGIGINKDRLYHVKNLVEKHSFCNISRECFSFPL